MAPVPGSPGFALAVLPMGAVAGFAQGLWFGVGCGRPAWTTATAFGRSGAVPALMGGVAAIGAYLLALWIMVSA